VVAIVVVVVVFYYYFYLATVYCDIIVVVAVVGKVLVPRIMSLDIIIIMRTRILKGVASTTAPDGECGGRRGSLVKFHGAASNGPD
jgi:hypothetical protein